MLESFLMSSGSLFLRQQRPCVSFWFMPDGTLLPILAFSGLGIILFWVAVAFYIGIRLARKGKGARPGGRQRNQGHSRDPKQLRKERSEHASHPSASSRDTHSPPAVSVAVPLSLTSTAVSRSNAKVAAAPKPAAKPEPPRPELRCANLTREELFQTQIRGHSTRSIRSGEIGTYLVSYTRHSQDNIRTVIDGFWEYLLEAAHYRKGVLVVPHFGTFRHRYDEVGARDEIIQFQSRPRKELIKNFQRMYDGQVTNDDWIAKRSEAHGYDHLSVRRRMVAEIAKEKFLDVRLVHQVVTELFFVLARIMIETEESIHWMRRGVMQLKPLPSCDADRALHMTWEDRVYEFVPNDHLIEEIRRCFPNEYIKALS